MSGIRKTSVALLAILIAAVAVHQFRALPFETQQAVAAGFGMVFGVAALGLVCWKVPRLRIEIVNAAGYPGFGPVSFAALFGGFAAHRIFTILMIG